MHRVGVEARHVVRRFAAMPICLGRLHVDAVSAAKTALVSTQ
jgi:hypothetical protein